MTRFNAVVFGLCLSLLGAVASVSAQPAPPTVTPPTVSPPTVSSLPDLAAALAPTAAAMPTPWAEAVRVQPATQPTWVTENRACPGCPRRSVRRALWQTTVINGLYGLANLARGQVTAEITPETWWENMQQGWVWDLDDFTVNQIGHPYQGSNYFTAGRANGLSFWESAALAAFGSATWEYFGETNHPSLNDFINTTLGGIALGEMFHRVGLAGAQYERDRPGALLERIRGDVDRSGQRTEPPDRQARRSPGRREAARHGAVGARGHALGRRPLARHADVVDPGDRRPVPGSGRDLRNPG